jgi:hypothetical protein
VTARKHEGSRAVRIASQYSLSDLGEQTADIAAAELAVISHRLQLPDSFIVSRVIEA